MAKGRRSRAIALLAAGMILGAAVTAAPTAAHVGGTVNHLVRHLKAFFYTKDASNTRFVNVDEAAGGDVTGTYSALQLGPDTVGGAEVQTNSLTGGDINEGSLGTVPSASSASNADLVDGIDSTALKPTLINFPGLANGVRTQILALGGLRLFATCSASSDLTLEAQTTLNNSVASASFVSDGPGANTPLHNEMEDLDVGETFNDILGSGDDEVEGTLTYRGPGGTSAVTVQFLAEEGTGFCFVSGTADSAS